MKVENSATSGALVEGSSTFRVLGQVTLVMSLVVTVCVQTTCEVNTKNPDLQKLFITKAYTEQFNPYTVAL